MTHTALDVVCAAGLRLEVAGDKLLVWPSELVSPEMRAFITWHKNELVADISITTRKDKT